MAVAKLVCGDCNALIAPTDAYCPSCGAKLEHGEGAPSPREGKPARRPGKKQAQAGTRAGSPPFEPWQIVAGVAVLGLVAYLVFSEISSETPRSSSQPPAATGTPANVPFLSGPAATVDLTPLEQAVAAAPNDAAALLRLANALHDSRSLPRAIEAYRKYLGMRPKDPDARTDLGICYFQLAQTDTINGGALLATAAREILEAHNGAPAHQASAFNLGVVYLHMQNLEESNTWFRRAVELNKDSDLGKRAQNILSQHSTPQ